MSEQLKQQTLYNVSEANTKNLIWVDVYVSGTEGSAGVYASRRMTKAQLIAFLNSNLTVAWSAITSKPTTLQSYALGGGTINRVAKFISDGVNPDGIYVSDSQILDNNTCVAINSNAASNARMVVWENRADTIGLIVTNTGQGTTYTQGINGIADGVSSSWKIGTRGTASGSTVRNIGVYGESAGNATGKSIGVYGLANVSQVENIAGHFEATASGAGVAYGLQVSDGTQAIGKYLKSITSDGKANWAYITPTVQTVASSATVTPVSTNDLVTVTAQATGLTLANPTGTFAEGQSLMIRIKDNGTAQTIAFGTNYRAIGITLPTTTVISKTIYLGIIYNSTDAKWDILGLNQQA